MTHQDMQAKLSEALRAGPATATMPKPTLFAGPAVAVAVLLGAAYLLWPSGGPLEIRASDRVGVEADLRRMVASVPDADREAYQSGFMVLLLDRYPPAQGLDGIARLAMVEPALNAAHETMDGVTVADILAAGRANLNRIAAKKAETAQAEAQAAAQKAALAECLRTRLPVTNATVVRGDFGRALTFTLTNNLTWAISGISVAFDITSEGRSVPWASERQSSQIAGGLEPGETKELAFSLFSIPPDAPENLTVTMRTTDVADTQQRQLVREVRVIGWSDEKSDLTCE